MKFFLRFLAIALLIFLGAGQALAADEVLIGDDTENGGYGGPVVKFSQIHGETAVFWGAYGGWLINHTFLIGGGAFGLTSEIAAPFTSEKLYYDLGYAGLVLEYINNSHKLVHYTVGALIGIGTVGYDSQDSKRVYADDTIFVLEPGIGLELNITTSFRANLGLSYLHIDGVKLEGTKAEDLSGATVSLSFKFGAF
ncbi:MAG TPA: hypothetical protein VIL66_05700 [Bacillota bacterium]